MKMFLIAAVAAGVFVFAGNAAACSDPGFFDRKPASMRQFDSALSYLRMEAYIPAKAWSLKSWQTLYVTAPCRPTYKRWRQYELNATSALWNAARVLQNHDTVEGARQLKLALHWTDMAIAEEANWE